MKLTPGSSGKDHEELADFLLGTLSRFNLALLSKLRAPEKRNTAISYPQFIVLNYLSAHESLTMGDIARKLGNSTAAATGLVDRLEELGYVERVHAQEDRRKIFVRITSGGTALVGKMRDWMAEELHEMLSEQKG